MRGAGGRRGVRRRRAGRRTSIAPGGRSGSNGVTTASISPAGPRSSSTGSGSGRFRYCVRTESAGRSSDAISAVRGRRASRRAVERRAIAARNLPRVPARDRVNRPRGSRPARTPRALFARSSLRCRWHCARSSQIRGGARAASAASEPGAATSCRRGVGIGQRLVGVGAGGGLAVGGLLGGRSGRARGCRARS